MLVFVPLLSLLPGSSLRAQAQDAPSGNVIVVLEGRTVPSVVQNVLDAVGFRVAFENVFTGFALTLNQAQANALAQADGVAGIFADRPVELSDTASTGVARIGAPSAAQMPNPAMVDATVAVVDSGVLANHSNLNVVGGFDAYEAVNANAGVVCGALTPSQQSTYESASKWGSASNSGHGTHVAGIIGAEGHDSVVGVAPGAGILGVKVFNTAGTVGTTSTIMCGLDWVLSNQSRFGIDAVNISIQGGDVTGGACSSDDLHLAICSVYNAGIPVVVSAGNNGAESLGAYSETISVSAFNDYDGLPGGLGTEPCNSTQATTADDRFATYSNTGEIMAPGTCIYSTWVNGGYQYDSGTSMAAPHVAGAVALYKSQNPSASPSQVEAWVQSASVPQSDPDGLVVSGASGGENVLHIGDIPDVPDGPYDIVGSASSPGSSSATVTYDGNMSTAWTTASNTPASGWFYVDLGSVKPIGTVRWVFGSGLGSLADSWQLQASNDATNWTTIAKRGNASPKSWQEQAVNKNARYIRFLYSNPNVETRLGGVAEIEVYAADGSATNLPTPTATPDQTPYTITNSGRSSGSSAPGLAYDNNIATSWVTTSSSVPSSAYIYFSLGSIKPIGTVRYMFGSGLGGYADSWQIQVSNDRVNWKNVATRGNASPKSWKEQVVDVNAMYVRFLFANPNGDPKLGGIAEVQILPATTTVASLGEPETPSPTVTATPTTPPGMPYTFTSSGRSSGSTAPALAYDGDLATQWITTSKAVPQSAYIYVSLGSVKPIGDVQWIFTETGWAKQYEIQISNDNATWTTVSTQTDAPAGEWQSATIGQAAKYVRFLFSNPTGTAKLGGIGELRVLQPADAGSPTATASVTATATATETATATPTEVPGTPVVTETATATETAVPTETVTPEPTETVTETATATDVPTEPGTPEGASEGDGGEQPIIESVTEEPTQVATEAPTEVVTEAPTEAPTEIVTEEPTEIPTEVPTEAPWTPGPGIFPAGAGQSDGSEQAARAFDSDLTTDWRTFDGTGQTEATLTVDLGYVAWVSEAWWYLSADAPGGRMEIEVSSDGETWQVVSQPSYLGDPEAWSSAPLGIEAQYIRFHFYNDDGRPSLGGLAEIVLLP
jgi:subtilisin family serine protease